MYSAMAYFSWKATLLGDLILEVYCPVWPAVNIPVQLVVPPQSKKESRSR